MTSPFSDNRFEYEAQHRYYLPDSCFPQLENPRPTYLIGSRGSGKTTLLKALHWRERLENKTLVNQLQDDSFRGTFIGTYMKFPTIQLSTMDTWLKDQDEANYGLVFSLYLDLIALELISHAIAELLARRQLNITTAEESSDVKQWMCDYPRLKYFGSHDEPRSVLEVRARIREARRTLERMALMKMDIEKTADVFPLEQIGSLGRLVASNMVAFCERDSTIRPERWHFKVCMDEGESLNAVQLHTVNTLVRLSEWPLFHTVSFVSQPADNTSTLVPMITQQKADRQVVVIDDLNIHEFQELAEGVATVRCQQSLNDPAFEFSTKRVLGSLSINRLLQIILERSENPKARQLLHAAEENQLQPRKSNELPIYETYLEDQLELQTQHDSRAARRHQESSQHRKKMVAAYLSICHELRVKHLPYASGEMVLSISDKCIRDYLSQLEQLYIDSKCELRSFLSNELDWIIQARSIRKASREKRNSIPDSGVLRPVEVGRVIKGLARITARIQRGSEDKSHLRSTERGLFTLPREFEETPEANETFALIQDAADAGFLRTSTEGGQIKEFRVHASLAPAYGFSYRGAYYQVSLRATDIENLRQADSGRALIDVADSIADRLSMDQADDETHLFEGDAE